MLNLIYNLAFFKEVVDKHDRKVQLHLQTLVSETMYHVSQKEYSIIQVYKLKA